MGFPRQEYWSGLPFLSLRGSSWARDQTHVSCISCFGRQILNHWATREPDSLPGRFQHSIFLSPQPVEICLCQHHVTRLQTNHLATGLVFPLCKARVVSIMCMHACSVASVMLFCATLWTVCCRPSSSAHGILQARVLNQVVMPSSRGSSRPRDQIQVSYISWIGRQVL